MSSPSLNARKASWALLIGIDLYLGKDGKRSKCLRGAVNDIAQVEEYLRPHDVEIMTLTAMVPPDDHSTRLQNDPALWPTQINVVACLQRMLKEAKCGSHVLIQYSGHGTRGPGDGSERNLALVLYSAEFPFSTYLYGSVLGECLKSMVDKGLIVTLVLDCCSSGSAKRDSQTVRAIDYSPIIDAASPNSAHRDAGPEVKKWHVNPDGYIIIAACGPTEQAHERKIGFLSEPAQLGESHYQGVLSYFLQKSLTVLNESGVKVSHESLCERLRVECQALRLQQTPMRFGDSVSTLFGTSRSSPEQEWPSLYFQKSVLFLNEGAVNGVSIGDIYNIFPFGSGETQLSTPRSVRVIEVYGSTSKVELMKTAQRAAPASIGTGWKAKPLSSASQRKIGVRISPDARRSLGETALSQEKRFMRPYTNDGDMGASDCIFAVEINKDDDYIILDTSLLPLEGVPTLSKRAPEAAERLMDILQHLSTYEYFKGIGKNMKDPDFDKSFRLQAFHEDKALDDTQPSVVKHGSTWRLEAKNFSQAPLYLALFNFTQSWKLINIRTRDNEAYRIIEAGCTKSINLPMVVPENLRDENHTRRKDVIKVFLTDKATVFPTLVLKALRADQKRLDRRVELDRAEDVSAFLAQLMFDAKRQGGDEKTLARWMTQNFTIWTVVENE